MYDDPCLFLFFLLLAFTDPALIGACTSFLVIQ